MTGQFSGTDAGNANLTITDGTTTGFGINKITVSAGDLTSASNGEAVIDTSGGGGGGGVSSISFDSTGLTPNTVSTGAIVVGGQLNIANGGTGASTAADARSNLSAAKSGVNSDITELAGLTTPLSVAQGGMGGTTPAQARDLTTGLGVLPKIADIRDISSSIVLDITDAGKVIFVNNNGASAVNIEVPGRDGTLLDGFQCVVIAYDNSGGAITLTPTDNGEINGATTPLTLTPYKATTLIVYQAGFANPLPAAKWVAIG